jgi:hypothetical protein
MTTTPFAISGISQVAADELRARGGITYIADSKPGYPCRQCLRDAEIGEEMILVSYDPFEQSSPYRCASPIFIHRSTCSPFAAGGLPEQLTSRKLSVRGFDGAAMMQDAGLVDGSELQIAIDTLFADPVIEYLHVHNAARGCWAARVDRSVLPIDATEPS